MLFADAWLAGDRPGDPGLPRILVRSRVVCALNSTGRRMGQEKYVVRNRVSVDINAVLLSTTDACPALTLMQELDGMVIPQDSVELS